MKRELSISVAISLTFLSLGFLLLHYGLIGYGFSFFVFLPFILGYVIGKGMIRSMSLLGLAISFCIFIILLLAGQLEGMVCVLMALPIILVATALGIFLKFLVKKNSRTKEDRTSIRSGLIPLFLFLSLGLVEKGLTKGDKTTVAINSEIVLPYSPMEVYETIRSVDTMDAEKPFLMKLDLPIPEKCILSDERVGGLRTCYFQGGKITERITALEKGKLLQMDVIDYQLTGRKWLGFKEAIYTFDTMENGHCRMTRTTTYTSELFPRFYWAPLERIGIEEEHDYVFANLKKDLRKKYGTSAQ